MEFRPFPGIPRFSEEPKLEGAPTTPEESILVTSPELTWLLDFPYKNSEGVHKEIKRYAEQLAAEPEKLEGLFAAFDMIENLPAYAKAIQYKERILEGIKKINFKETPTLPDVAIEKWLSYHAEDTIFKDIAENFLKKYIESHKGHKAVVDCVYNLFLIAVKSGNEKIQHLASRIICNDAQNTK